MSATEATPAGTAPAEPTPAVVTPTVHEAKAVREELWDRMQELERAVTAAVGPDEVAWWSRVLGPLGALRGAFQAHLAVTEGPGGLYEETLGFAPRLAHARDRLVHDHVGITAALDQLARPSLPPGGAAEARDAALALLARLSRHRHLGADFVYEAYNFDMGGGD